MCNVTRWNSELVMFLAFCLALKLKPGLQDQLNAFKKHGKVNREDLKSVKEVTLILESIKEATDEFQKDSETVSSVVPAIVDLTNKMEVFADPSNPNNKISVCHDFAKALLDSLKKRFAFVFEDRCYLVGM